MNTHKFVTGFVGLECLRILVNELEVASLFNTDQNKDFQKPFAIGETTLVKQPQRWLVTNGLKYQEQGISRRAVPVTMREPFGIHFAADSLERAIYMERSELEISDQLLKPAMSQLAQEIDSQAALFAYQNTNNIVGALGTTPTAMSTYNRARTLLKENSCPWTGAERKMIISPAMMENAVSANAVGTNPLFNPPSEIAQEFREGEVGTYAGSTWHESMSLYDHTSGIIADVSTLALAAAPASGATQVLVNGTAGDTFKQGDVIAFDYQLATQVNNANPSTRRSTGRVKTFVATQDLTLIGGGNAADLVSIYPAIEGPGSQYQNVDALPGANATVTVFPGSALADGAAKHGVNGINFTKDAFAMVSAPLEMPTAVEPISFMKRDPKTGVAIRLVAAWDQNLSRITYRFETMIGFGALYADNCSVRILSLQ